MKNKEFEYVEIDGVIYDYFWTDWHDCEWYCRILSPYKDNKVRIETYDGIELICPKSDIISIVDYYKRKGE